MALGAYSTQYDISQLTTNQFNLVDKIITILTPIEDITQSISSNNSCISVMIPFVKALTKHLEKNDDSDKGVRTMKKEMLESMNRRFRDIDTNESLVLGTILDPCFKDKFFTDRGSKAKSLLLNEVKKLNEEGSGPSGHGNEVNEPPPKRQKTVVLQYLSEILEEDGVVVDHSLDEHNAITAVEKYLAEPLVSFHTGSVDIWWKENQNRYPQLAQLALRYLSAPSTSVHSERLFSLAGMVYTDRQCRLLPEKAEQLLFIKCNYNFVGGIYSI